VTASAGAVPAVDVYWLPYCSTCTKAIAHLQERGVPISSYRNLKEEPLSEDDRIALGAMREALVERLVGVDTVVYDTHFTPDEYARFPHYGHSTPDQALEICAAAKVRRLVLYHHAPSHGDEQMDKIAAEYLAKGAAVGIEVLTSFEGMTLPIGEAAT
jgi:hypothetical protein